MRILIPDSVVLGQPAKTGAWLLLGQKVEVKDKHPFVLLKLAN